VLIDDSSIDAVLFDAGGVLILPGPDGFRSVLAPFGVEPDDETCRRAHYEGMRECDRLGGPKWPVVDRVVARVAGVHEDHIEDAIEAIHLVYQDLPWVTAGDSASCLTSLAAAGKRTGVVSNANGKMEMMLRDLAVCAVASSEPAVTSSGPAASGTDDTVVVVEPFAGDGAMARVGCVIDSHVVGVEKPDPRIFHIALDHLELDPARCAFVGDTVVFDVNGARAAGLRPFHLDPYELCPDDDHEHVRDLADLLVSAPTSGIAGGR
jgi:putative hydrolase of the HAD superfamily